MKLVPENVFDEIDRMLLVEARRLTGLKEPTAVLREALRALIERESARRLANLGGSEPELTKIPRRRSEVEVLCTATSARRPASARRPS